MKPIFITILAILYLAGATNATVHIHYCMGKLMGISLIDKQEDRCKKCSAKKCKNKSCCKHEHKTIKSSEHHLAKALSNFSHEHATVPVISRWNTHYTENNYAGNLKAVPMAHAPPALWRTCPIYIQVRDFRI